MFRLLELVCGGLGRWSNVSLHEEPRPRP